MKRKRLALLLAAALALTSTDGTTFLVKGADFSSGSAEDAFSSGKEDSFTAKFSTDENETEIIPGDSEESQKPTFVHVNTAHLRTTEFVANLDYCFLTGLELTVKYGEGELDQILTFTTQGGLEDSYGNVLEYRLFNVSGDDEDYYMAENNLPEGSYRLEIFCNDEKIDSDSNCTIHAKSPESLPVLHMGNDNPIESPEYDGTIDEYRWYTFTAPETAEYYISPISELQIRKKSVYDYGTEYEYVDYSYNASDSCSVMLEKDAVYYMGFSGVRLLGEDETPISKWNVKIQERADITYLDFSEKELTFIKKSDEISRRTKAGTLTVSYSNDIESETIEVTLGGGTDRYGNEIGSMITDSEGKEVLLYDKETGKDVEPEAGSYKLVYFVTIGQEMLATEEIPLTVCKPAACQWEVTSETPATCTKGGHRTEICKVHGEVKETSTPAAGHKWDKGKVTKQATCKAEGVKTYTCTVCKGTKTESIPKSENHKWDSGKVTKAATCKIKGVKTYTCTVCKGTKTESIPKTKDHKWDKGKITKQTSCKAEGVKTYTCTVCKGTRKESIAKAHRYGKWHHVYTDPGEKLQRTCSVCKKKEEVKSGSILPGTVSIKTKSFTIQQKHRIAIAVPKGDRITSWNSSNSKVAGVEKTSARIRALNTNGKTLLTIYFRSGKTMRVKVTVQNDEVITTSKINFKKRSFPVAKDSTRNAREMVELDPVASEEKITYKSSNRSVATVKKNGDIQGIRYGTSRITVTSGNQSRSFYVRVY